MFDVHMHLPDDAPVDIDTYFGEARQAGMTGFVLAGTSNEDSRLYAEMSNQAPDIYACAGMHPQEAEKYRDEYIDLFRELLQYPKVVAVGEIGMDFYYEGASEERQRNLLIRMLQLANEVKKPVVIHCREAFRQCYPLVKEYYDCSRPFLVHSFTGSLEEQTAWLELGAYMSFNGMVTFKKADNVRQILAAMPRDRIVLETDSPWLAPVPHRGQPNTPAYVPLIAERIGFELGLDVADVAKLTVENTRRLFNLD